MFESGGPKVLGVKNKTFFKGVDFFKEKVTNDLYYVTTEPAFLFLALARLFVFHSCSF
jgi:hypothetical protein